MTRFGQPVLISSGSTMPLPSASVPGAGTSTSQVAGPTWPSTVRSCICWNVRTAFAPFGSKYPSTLSDESSAAQPLLHDADGGGRDRRSRGDSRCARCTTGTPVASSGSCAAVAPVQPTSSVTASIESLGGGRGRSVRDDQASRRRTAGRRRSSTEIDGQPQWRDHRPPGSEQRQAPASGTNGGGVGSGPRRCRDRQPPIRCRPWHSPGRRRPRPWRRPCAVALQATLQLGFIVGAPRSCATVGCRCRWFFNVEIGISRRSAASAYRYPWACTSITSSAGRA